MHPYAAFALLQRVAEAVRLRSAPAGVLCGKNRCKGCAPERARRLV